jgi:hypothetical protein
VALSAFLEKLEKGQKVAVLVEQVHPAIAAIDYMVDHTAGRGSRASSHDMRVPEGGAPSQ